MKKNGAKILEPLVTLLCGGCLAVALMTFYYSSTLMGSCVQQISPANDIPPQIQNESSLSQQVIEPTKQTYIDQELSELLQKAAMDDKTILMTEINGAWSDPGSLFDLFLESFHVGFQIEHLLNHMIVIATDDKAFDKCKSVHPHCYRHKVDGADFSGEQIYHTKVYDEMMWNRNKLQRSVLEMGYTLLFTDADIMWFRNPLQHISVIAEMTVACDGYHGNPDSFTNNDANMGFMYVKPTNRTISFYKDWYEARVNFPGNHDQEVFQKIGPALSAKHHVNVRFLDTSYVGGLCQPKIDFTKLCTFHATCRVGIVSKINESRRILNDWKIFKEKYLNFLSTNASQT